MFSFLNVFNDICIRSNQQAAKEAEAKASYAPASAAAGAAPASTSGGDADQQNIAAWKKYFEDLALWNASQVQGRVSSADVICVMAQVEKS